MVLNIVLPTLSTPGINSPVLMFNNIPKYLERKLAFKSISNRSFEQSYSKY